jgi:hypothetical protein
MADPVSFEIFNLNNEHQRKRPHYRGKIVKLAPVPVARILYLVLCLAAS